MPSTPPLPPPTACRCCGASFGPWADLPLVGHMDLEEDGDGRIEMRNCPDRECAATYAIDRGAAS